MSDEIINNEKITYSNWFIFCGQILSFKNKELFNITNTPKWIPFNYSSNCWIINGRQLSIEKAKDLIKHEQIHIDISDLQWSSQIELTGCFNLEKHEYKNT